MKTLNRKHKELITNSGIFDPVWYSKRYPDVGLSSLDPLKHFLQIGIYMHRMPNALFDPKWYLEKNTDVAEAGIEPLCHYLKYGWKEGRDPSSKFNAKREHQDYRNSCTTARLHDRTTARPHDRNKRISLVSSRHLRIDRLRQICTVCALYVSPPANL